MRARRIRVLGTVVALVSVAIGCSGSGSDGGLPVSGNAASVTAHYEEGETISIVATNFRLRPSIITAQAGSYDIELKNNGTVAHELLILRTDTRVDALPVGRDGRVSEEDSIGEIPEIEPGEASTGTFELEPGDYLILCNIAEHYELGMRGTLTVR